MTITVNAFGKNIQFPADTPPEEIEKHIANNRAVLDPDYKQPGIADKLSDYAGIAASAAFGGGFLNLNRENTPSISDYAKGFASGANKLVSGAGYLAEIAGAKDTGKAIREFGDRGSDYWINDMSERGKQAAATPVFEDDENSITGIRLTDDWGRALLMGAAQSTPTMFAAAIPGAATTSAIQKLASLGLAGGSGATIPLLAGTAAPVGVASNVIARAPAAVGFGAWEGITSGAINAADFKTSIEKMSVDELRKSPVFAALESRYGEEKAKQLIAEQAASDVFGRTAVSTGTIGALTGGGALGQAYQKATGAAKGGIASQILKGAGQEALQEAPQSGGEKLIENVATRDYIDPNQNIMEGVIADAASGAAIGGFMGGVVGGGGAINITPSDRAAKINEERTKLGLQKIASAGSVDEAIQAANETVSQKPVTTGDVFDDAAQRDTLLSQLAQNATSLPLSGQSITTSLPISGQNATLLPDQVLESTESSQNQTVEGFNNESILSQAGQENNATQSDITAQKIIKGNKTEIVLPDNTSLPAQWEVVDADTVKATLKDGINQPRDRSRAASDVQINQIANNPDYRRLADSPVMDVGSPTIDSSGAIVGGNGRFEGVSRGYDSNTSSAYRAALEADAINKGIDPASFAGMKKPVLVRRITQPFDTGKLAVASNSGTSLEYSTMERARIDSGRLKDLSEIEVTDSGDIALTASNMANIRNSLNGYPSAEVAAFVGKDGNLSQEGMRRFKNAILHTAYGDSATLGRMIESTDSDMRNVVGALTKVAGQVSKVRSDIKAGGLPKELDLTGNLIEAVEKLGQLRANGETVQSYLAQQSMFPEVETSQEAKEIVQALSDMMRSQKRMTEFLRSMYDAIAKVDVTTQNIFGEQDIPTKLEIIKHAKRQQETTGPDNKPDAKTGQESATEKDNAGGGKEGTKYSRSAEERLKDRVKSRRLEELLRQGGHAFKITPADMRDFVDLGSGTQSETIAAEQIAKIFRKRITPIKADGPFRINGVIIPSIGDTIFIDVRTEKVAHAVMGHELSHHMERDAPEVYAAMVDALESIITNTKGYREKYQIPTEETNENVIKEIVGDIMGDNFTQPEFWNKVAAYNPNAFRKIADTIISWIKKLVTNAKMRGLGSEQWVTDAQKAQDVVAKAVSQYTYTESSFNGLKNKAMFQTAWHGSPHDHDKFSTDKIGTGEGAQAYGFGLYFAESKDVAEWYKNKLSGASYNLPSGRKLDVAMLEEAGFKQRQIYLILTYLRDYNGDPQLAAGALRRENKYNTYGSLKWEHQDQAARFLGSLPGKLESTYGKIYQVELAPKEDEYLLWDKPLSEQSEKVRNIISQDNDKLLLAKSSMSYGQFDPTKEGQGHDLYKALSAHTGSNKSASTYLHSLGIRGIKYLDGTSRGKGEGSFNYVIFDDKDVAITAKFSKEGISTAEAEHDGIKFKTGKKVTFNYLHNKESATSIYGKPKKGDRFGRDKEPSGKYVTYVSKETNPGYGDFESRKITFNNPLVINNDNLKWKEKLSNAYNGLTGKNLSRALINDGYDGVVTVDYFSNRKSHTSEILDLTSFDYSKAKFSFAGQNSKTADKHQLSTAQERLAKGENVETVRKETGWFKGVDGKWRYEINDSEASLKKPFPDEGQRWGDVFDAALPEHANGIWLRDLLDHPKLYAAYPNLENTLVLSKTGRGASYVRSTGDIWLGRDLVMSDAASTLLHEIQHGIQNIEGFAMGGSPDSIAGDPSSYLSKSQIDYAKSLPAYKSKSTDAERSKFIDDYARNVLVSPEKAYGNLAGEIEARNVQFRQKWNEDQRRETSPEASADIPSEEAIIVYNGKVMENAPVPANAIQTTEKNLYVAHNLTAENIRHADEIGGLAAPSLAVAKTGKGFSGFGEITLIAKPDLLKTRNVRTFDADAYTPRHPRASHEVNRKKYDSFVESLGDVKGLDIPNLEELSDSYGIEAITRSPGIQYHWLSTKGKQPAIKPKPIDADTRKIVKLMEKNGLVKEWQAEQNDKVMSAVNSYIDGKIEDFRGRIKGDLGEAEENNLRRNYKNNILLSASRYIESGGKDLGRLKNEVTDKISRNKNLENEFKLYALSQFNMLVDSKKIFKGFTPSGKKKYIPYDMDNIVKEMTRTLKAGEDFFYGAGNIRAAFAKEYRNISEIQADRDRIVSPDEMEKIKDDAQNKVSDAIEALKPYYRFEKDSINYYSDAAQAIAEGRKGQNEVFNLDDNARKIIDDLVNYLRHLPTEYFEAKAQRPVAFNEFESAVVPKGTPKDVIDILKNNGLRVQYYTRGDEQSRDDAVAKSAEKNKALFSRSTQIPETVTIDGKERPTRNSEGKLIHPTEEGIRNFYAWFKDSKVVDDDGKPMVFYHGTSSNFDKFDAGKIGSGRGTYSGNGFYFTSSITEAGGWADLQGDSPFVLPVYIRMSNPHSFYLTNRNWQAEDGFSERLRSKGFDGVIVRYRDINTETGVIEEDWIGELVAFEPNQIKSAIGNTGQFSPGNDDIRFSRSANDNEINKYLNDYKELHKKLLDDNFIKNNDVEEWIALSDKAFEIRDKIAKKLEDGSVNGLGVEGDALLSKNANGSKNKWRISYFTKDGEPSGHSEYTNAKDAVSDFLNPSRSEKLIALFSRTDTLSQAGVDTREKAKDTGLPEETKMQAFRRQSQDAMLRFKVVQKWLEKQGRSLSEAANVYQRENISKGKTANKIEDFRRDQLEPLIKRIAETSKKADKEGKFDLGDIATYLEALHIPEANERMRLIHKDDKATANGITDEQARKVIKEFEAMPNFAEFKELAEEMRSIGSETLDMRLDAGLISQDQYDAYKSTYKLWVPLRGNMSVQGFGKGMSTNAKDKRRMGHGFREDEFVIENLVQDRERAIMQIEKNKLGMSVATFLLEAENPNIGTIDEPKPMRVMKDFSYAVTYKGSIVGSFETEAGARSSIDKILSGRDTLFDGESFTQTDFAVEKTYDPHIVMAAKPQLAENEIQVYVNGHAVKLQLNDAGLARAATNAGIEQVGAILYGARQFNRFLSKAYTAWSPDFLFMNMARDAYSGTLVLTGKKGAAFAAKTFTNYGAAIKELIKGRKYPSKSKWVTRYRAAGGNIGAAYLSDIERIGDDAIAALQEFAGARETYRMVYNEQISKGASEKKARTMAALKAGVAKTKAMPVVGHMFETLERINMIIENALRLATFKTAIESGESDQQAAILSKDLMNFNRKGEIANQMGALYLFYNPGMQGAHIVGEALFTSKHRKQVWALLGALTTVSFMLAELVRGGDDDDERDWENVPEYLKDRNLIFKVGDKQITVPVAYGFGIFHAMGNYLSDLNHGADKNEIAVKLASGMFENFSVFGNPILDNDGNTEIRLDQLLPTLPKLIMGPGINLDSLGRQIQPVKARWNESIPDSQNMTRSVRGTVYEDIAHFMNDNTGGSKYNPGYVDVSPNTIKYWVTSLTGGAGRFVSDITTGGMNAAEGVAPELENVPVLRKFIREPGVTDSRAAFFKAKKEADTANKRYNKALKDGDVFESQKMFDENQEIIALANFADASSKMASAKRDFVLEIQQDKDLSKAEKKLRIKDIELQEQRIYDDFLSYFDDAKRKMKK